MEVTCYLFSPYNGLPLSVSDTLNCSCEEQNLARILCKIMITLGLNDRKPIYSYTWNLFAYRNKNDGLNFCNEKINHTHNWNLKLPHAYAPVAQNVEKRSHIGIQDI